MCHLSQNFRVLAAAVCIVALCVGEAIADEPRYAPTDQTARPAAVAGSATPNRAVIQATHAEPAQSPSGAHAGHKPIALPGAPTESAGEKTPSGPRTFGAIVTVVVSLAIVLGLFAGCAWLMRRGLPGAARTLPADAVSVLGRAPLAGRQQMHLIRFGNKMLLVCVSPSGVDSLGEITDPAEIDRLAGLCEQEQATSATAAFKQIFGQVARGQSPARWLAPKSTAAKGVRDA